MYLWKNLRKSVGNILIAHYNRSDPNRTYKNQKCIDRTHWNYNLAKKHEGMTDEFMKSKCEEFKILKEVMWIGWFGRL